MDEFQESDILWPDTAPSQEKELAELVFVPSEMYELAASMSSGASLFAPSEGFLSGAPSTAGMSAGADHEEELQEADVLWPDTVLASGPRWGAGVSGGFVAILHGPDGTRSLLPPPLGARSCGRPCPLPSTYQRKLPHVAASKAARRGEPSSLASRCFACGASIFGLVVQSPPAGESREEMFGLWRII